MISTNRSAYVAYQMIAGQDDCNFVTKTNIVDMLQEEKITRICAPMVRYSRLPFRLLVRKYKSDLAYTPMIVANSFVQSQKCFDANLTTNDLDTPLIAQFAANNATDFAAAAEISYPLVDGVDLNCGCPQRWAMLDGYGAQLIETPEKIVDFVKFTRSRISDSKFSISTKIRIHDDIRKTVNLCQSLEKIGVSFIAIHGRTAKERKQPVHYDVIKLVKDSISIPVIANGDVVSLETMQEVHRLTGCDGVMAAQGLLNNPAMFEGYTFTPIQCVQDWLNICDEYNFHFTPFHNHLIYMLAKVLSRPEKRMFNALKTRDEVTDFLHVYLSGEKVLGKF